MKTMIDYFNSFRASSQFAWNERMVFTDAKLGHMEMEFKTDAVVDCNFRGDLHGAIYMGFADVVMGTACFTLGKSVCTVEMNGNFIKAVCGGETLRAVGNVEHNGKTTMVSTGRLYNESGELVYLARGTFFVLETMELPDLPWNALADDDF